MKSTNTIKSTLPILRWILIAFLVTGISEVRENSREVYPIENVDYASFNSGQEARIFKYPTFQASSLSPKTKLQSCEIIKLLSSKLSQKIQIALKIQATNPSSFAQIDVQFISRNPHSGPNDESSNFIS